MRALAKKHGINAAGLMKRAEREGWDAERQQLSATVSKTASDALVESRIDELTKFNEADLRIAKALREKAEAMMLTAEAPSDLRALAGAIDVAQKVGRLALGATTGNTGLSAPNGGPVGVQSVHAATDEHLLNIATSSGP
jgi:hypothetical protein